ncbi:MAG: S41 family peptidase, partial [Chitinophagaceae bacterium]
TYSTSVKKDFVSNNIFLLGKTWGFLKYYHPQIAAGKYDWDKELIEFLPDYVKATTIKERNDLLESWIKKFGDVPVCESCNESISTTAKLKPAFDWIQNNELSSSLVSMLQNIKKNRIQNGQYYIKFYPEENINYAEFQHEPSYSNLQFPNDGYSLLSLFRIWNIIEYWYPYKYDLPVPWDTILKQFIPKMLALKNTQEYTALIAALMTKIHDSHVFFRSALMEEMTGKYFMPFTIKVIENKILVTSILNDSLAALSNVQVGDIIESIENALLPAMIEKYKEIISASNEGSFLQKLSYNLTRTSNANSHISIQRNNTNFKTITSNYIPNIFKPVYLDPTYFSYAKDSAFCIINDQIGYLNVGNFNRKDSLELEKMMGSVSKLIIDNRQNQDEQNGTGGGDIIANLILPADNNFVRFSTLDPTYPGVFTLTAPTNMGTQFNTNYFKGNIIILINENTMSVGEFLTMAFQKAEKAHTLGTTTAGADGNVVYVGLPGGISLQFTGLGVYYPDGSETQRVGIQPDIMVEQTIEGYRKNNDEQLNKAVEYLQKTGK